MCLNYPKLVQEHSADLVSPVMMKIENVRYSRTTLNKCKSTLQMMEIRQDSVQSNHPKLMQQIFPQLAILWCDEVCPNHTELL